MDEEETTLSLVLFSGTDDKLSAAAVLAVGAAAMGRTVNVFLQYYALDAFRADRIGADHALSPEATAQQAPAVKNHPGTHWSELFRQAKEVGEVSVHACALSMEMFKLEKTDLDPLVDDVEGVAAFMGDATGPMVFI
jgi:peroxiredoxin family protein